MSTNLDYLQGMPLEYCVEFLKEMIDELGENPSEKDITKYLTRPLN